MNMKRLMISLTLCLAVGWASASVDLRVFQSTAGAAWPRLEAQLTESGKITSEGLIDAGTLAGIAVQVAIERGVLKDPTEEERQAYGMAFLGHNGIGATIHKDQFRAIGADKDPKKGFRLPDPRAAVQATAQPAVVPAASAPTPTVVTAVTSVPTDALATEIASLRQQLLTQKTETAAAILRLTGEAQVAARQKADQLTTLERQLQDETKKIVDRLTAGDEIQSSERAALKTTFKEVNAALQAHGTEITNIKNSWVIRFGELIWAGLVLVLFAIGAAAFTALSRTRESKLKETVAKQVGEVTAPILAKVTSAETVAVGASGVASTALGCVDELRDDFEVVKASLPKQRQVKFPDQFSQLVQAISEDEKSTSQVFTIEVEGEKPFTIVVQHSRPGYVKVRGLPGVNPNDEIKLYKPKSSKRWNGLELLIFGLANQGALDVVPSIQKSA